MSTNFAFLLTPIFSRYDVLESGIVSLYLQKALNKTYPNQNNYIINLMSDTPWLLYQSYGLYNPSRTIIDPNDTKEGLGPQQVILILAYTAVVCAHMSSSSVVVVNGNGPVVNTGYASCATLATAMGKKLVYWKDDARRLWGFNDNPLMIGTMPSVSDHLMDPAGFPNRLNLFDNKQPNNCGKMVLPDLITSALNTPNNSSDIKLSPVLQNLIDFGKILNTAFVGSDVTWRNILVDPLKSYKKLKGVFKQHAQQYISPKDFAYIKTVLDEKPSDHSRSDQYHNNKSMANMQRSMSYPNPDATVPKNPITPAVLQAYENLVKS